MLRDITIGRYIEGKSPLHTAAASTKIIAAVIYSAAVIICSKSVTVAAAAAFTAAAIAIAKIPFKLTLKGLKPLRWLIIFTAAANILFAADGNTLWHWQIINITDTGIATAVITAVKLILFVLGTSVLTLTTAPIALTDGFARLMSPLKVFKIPTDDIAMIISITLRFIPIVADEADKIVKAQKARGSGLEKKGRVRAVIPLIVPMFMGALRHAEELSLAMDARCYGRGTRTSRKKEKFGKNDIVIISSLILFCIFLIFIEIWH